MPTQNPIKESSSTSNENPERVESQLQKICSSACFKSAPQMKGFLQYVVRKMLAGKEDKLKQYTIAVEGLALPTDFDSDQNPLIRIIAGRVRNKLDKYYKHEGKNDSLLITIPKGSYKPAFIERHKTAVRIIHSSGPKIALICFSDKTQGNSSNRLIHQLSDNLAKEFSHFIFSKLIVSIPHADKENSGQVEREMKDKFQVDYILELSMYQIQRENFQLVCRLQETQGNELIWSERYEIAEKPSLKVQHILYGKITSTVMDLQQGMIHVDWARKLLVTPNDIPAEHKVLAYYRNHADRFTPESFKLAVQACQQALQFNPMDLIANVVFADYCRREFVYGYKVIETPLKTGRNCAEKAIRLKPDSHEAHYVLGQILFNLGENEMCLHEFKIARNISKNHALVTFGMGYHLCIMNQWDQGMPLVYEAIALNPLHPDWYNLAPFLNEYRQGGYEAALQYALKIITPGIYWGPLARAVSYAQLGKTIKAEKELQELLKRFPNFKNKGKNFQKRFLGYPELSQQIWDGLKKAGVEKYIA